jgi:hypothetical protein
MPAYIRADDGTIWDAETQSNPDVHGNESRNSFKWSCYHHKLGIFFQQKVKDAILRALNAIHSRNSYIFEGGFLVLRSALYESISHRVTDDPTRKAPILYRAADLLVYYIKNENELQRLQKNKPFRTSVDFAHRGIKQYDKEAFVYEDVRLQEISSTLKNDILVYFQSNETLLKIIDICVFLMKEDIFYRPRWIQILQDIRETVKTITVTNSSNLLITLCKLCEVCKDMTLTPTEIENIERWH